MILAEHYPVMGSVLCGSVMVRPAVQSDHAVCQTK